MGIADAHGIESFVPVDGNEKQAFIFKMRAMANRHRHALWYIVEISEAGVKRVQKEIDKRDWPQALRVLKKSKKTLWLPDQANAIKSWNLIPNSDLDPYSD